MFKNAKKTFGFAILLIVLIFGSYKLISYYNQSDIKKDDVEKHSIIISKDKLRVDYFFWLRCGACNQFEPYVSEWYKGLDDKIEFNFIPVGWGNTLKDAEPYYIAKKLYEDGILTKDDYLLTIIDIFDITFKDNKVLNRHNTFKKLSSRSIFKTEADFNKYIDDNLEYINNGIEFSKFASAKYGIGSVPIFIIDGSKSVSLNDYNGDPKRMFNAINNVAVEKMKKNK